VSVTAGTPAPPAEPPTPPQLPGARDGRDPARAIKRGPSRVPRELVVAAQRDRLYDALVQTVARQGYVSATVTDIARAAGVTRPAFYEHFTGKEAAFLAAYRHGTGVLFHLMEQAYRAEADWSEAIRAGLKVMLDVLASVPAFATMAIVEIDAVGQQARDERALLLARFRVFFVGAPWVERPVDRGEIVDIVVGGVYSAVYRYVATGRAGDLPDLLADVTFSVLAPFLAAGRPVPPRPDRPAGPRAAAPCAPQFIAPDHEASQVTTTAPQNPAMIAPAGVDPTFTGE
jgi:AcrR family transcriptional regulator